MKNHTGLLDEALNELLPRAIDQDRGGAFLEMREMIDGDVPSCEELAREFLEFYREHGEAIDAAIQSGRNFLDSPGGVARGQALQASLESPDSELLSTDLASGILNSEEFGLLGDTNRLQGLQAIGVGASAGLSIRKIGGLAGLEIVIDTDNPSVQPRLWAGVTFIESSSVNYGLEISVWFNNKPLKGTIMGLVLDVYIPLESNPIYFYIRVLYIRERPQEGASFISSAVTIQFPWGAVSTLKKSLNVGAFVAYQWAQDRTKRASLDVVNESDGGTTIAVEENTTLKVTFKNTSVYDYGLEAESTLTFNMPEYFTDEDIAAMSIDASKWSFAADGGKLVLTAKEYITWASNSTLTFEITNVSSSKTPISGAQSFPGNISASLQSTATKLPITATTAFDLVWSSSQATLTWSAKVNSEYFVFTDGAPSSGTTTANAVPGSIVQTLTTAIAQDGSDEVWVLGYIYNYNTATKDIQPQVMAVWWKQGAVQIVGKTLFEGNVVTPYSSNQNTNCDYGDRSELNCNISIDVAFDDSSSER